MKKQDKKIERLETENAETSKWNDELLTKNVVLTMDLERNTDDYKTLKARLDDNSCAYCGTMTPRQAPPTYDKHFIAWGV